VFSTLESYETDNCRNFKFLLDRLELANKTIEVHCKILEYAIKLKVGAKYIRWILLFLQVLTELDIHVTSWPPEN
jgi:hypothetical protein